MPTYAVLLRGVNVGGRSKLAMADLRAVLESLGHTDVSTYLQSGNAVITSSRRGASRLEREIETALHQLRGKHTDVLVRSGAQLAAVIADNPFPDAVAEPTNLHVAFLAEQPSAAQLRALEEADYAPDQVAFGDRVAYLRYANGSQASKLGAVLGRWKGVATSRNWNTVQALARRTAGE